LSFKRDDVNHVTYIKPLARGFGRIVKKPLLNIDMSKCDQYLELLVESIYTMLALPLLYASQYAYRLTVHSSCRKVQIPLTLPILRPYARVQIVRILGAIIIIIIEIKDLGGVM